MRDSLDNLVVAPAAGGSGEIGNGVDPGAARPFVAHGEVSLIAYRATDSSTTSTPSVLPQNPEHDPQSFAS